MLFIVFSVIFYFWLIYLVTEGWIGQKFNETSLSYVTGLLLMCILIPFPFFVKGVEKLIIKADKRLLKYETRKVGNIRKRRGLGNQRL